MQGNIGLRNDGDGDLVVYKPSYYTMKYSIVYNFCHNCIQSYSAAYQYKMSTKDKRSPNFTKGEKELLIDLVELSKGVVEDKKSDSTFAKAKDEEWKNIAEKFNSRSDEQICAAVASPLWSDEAEGKEKQWDKVKLYYN